MEQEINFSVGQWIVHSHYGVGQIKKTELMPFHGEQTDCFMVQVKGGAFWFPTNTVKNPRIRTVGSQEVIAKVIKNLRRKPGNIEKDKQYWNTQIKAVPSQGDLLTISPLIRDLSAQQSLDRLNDTQVRALTKFKERLLLEWSTITGTDVRKIRSQFYEYIQESRTKIMNE